MEAEVDAFLAEMIERYGGGLEAQNPRRRSSRRTVAAADGG